MKLSSQAIQILNELKETDKANVRALESKGYDQSMVNRAALELSEVELVEIDETEEVEFEITDTGEEVRQKGSPEYRLAEKVKDEPKEMQDLQELNLDVALGKARQKNWIEIEKGRVKLIVNFEDIEDSVAEKLNQEEFSEQLIDRGLVEKVEKSVREIRLTEEGQEIETSNVEEKFDVEARSKTPRTGKKHYYKNILQYARQTWMEMGFEEMGGDYIVPSFLNFDALYTPQDHPARELHDTFFVENPAKADLEEYGQKVQHVKETHEDGWETGSTGYGSDWSKEEAEKNVIRTHTTAISARRLHEIDINEEELPKKFFIVGRNFRNETVDRTHLAEFYQTDGIVVGKDLNFKNLKGYISEFFKEMGYSEFRLIPSYYPYTEMSVEVQVWDEEDEEWMGMGGAGMFRPEVVKPMLGFEAKVLAWGLGIPRIAAGAAGLTDIRELYRNDIQIIDQTPVWRPDWNNETMEGE